MSSLLIPTGCLPCSRTWLAPPAFELPAVCPSCHGQGNVVPGECYRADDVPLFEAIERAVFAAQLSEQASYQVWALLSNVSERWRRPDLLLLPVVEAIPPLQFLIEEFAADRTQLARAVGMGLAAVTTQLRAAEARRQQCGSLVPEQNV
jgi:hypothetical protein